MLPLLIEHGAGVTTRQIANAAGVSEGTIFNVFADKHELLAAALEVAIDLAPFELAIEAIDRSTPFEQRLVLATELIQRRIVDIWKLVSQLGPQHQPADHKPLPDSRALADLFADEPSRLRIEPNDAARLLRALSLSLTHPMMTGRTADRHRHRRPVPERRRRRGERLLMSLRQLLRTHLAPYKQVLWIVVVLQAIQTSATLALPTLNADLINKGVLVGDNGYIWRTGVVMIGFSFVQIVFAAAAVWFGARAAMGFGRDLRRDLFHQVTDYSAREVGRFGAPSLITRITNDVQQVQMLVVLAATMMIAAPLTMVIGIVLAVREDVGLSVILIFAMPGAVILLGSIVSRMVPAFQLMQVRIDRVNGVLREQITGIRVVRAFVREPQEVARFAEANDELTDTALRTGRLMAATFPTVGLIINVSSLAVLWIGADRIAAGDMQVGSLVAYLSYLIQILIAVVMATFMASMIPRAAVAADRIVEVLDTDSSVRPPVDPVTEVPEHGTLEFRDVDFSYAGAQEPVLCGISFRVEAGQTTAIIGSTGAGKTTVVNLIARLFDATSGAVLVDGVDVRDLDPDLLWGKVGYVPQKAFLFSGHGRLEPALRPPGGDRSKSCGRRSRSPRRRVSCRRCPMGSTAKSPRAARTCRVVNVSGCRSPGRSSPIRRSSCSTTRSRRSTWPPMLACERRSSRRPGTPRW